MMAKDVYEQKNEAKVDEPEGPPNILEIQVDASHGLEAKDAELLKLSYRSIRQIESLDYYFRLQRLHLDNNEINKIEKLDTLTSLNWLDLSFNQIEVIEGLDKLLRLEDLNLAHNRIKIVQNLDSCKKLECLSLSMNEIEDLQSLVYLRGFRNLRSLSVGKNPFATLKQVKRGSGKIELSEINIDGNAQADRESKFGLDDIHEVQSQTPSQISDSKTSKDYKGYLIAFIPQLIYLDYSLIKSAERFTFSEQYRDELRLIEDAEQQMLQNEKNAAAYNIYFADIEKARMACIETLVLEIFKGDAACAADGVFNVLVDGFPTLLETYKKECKEHANSTIKKGLKLSDEAFTEFEIYKTAVNKEVDSNDTQALEIYFKMEETKAKLVKLHESEEHHDFESAAVLLKRDLRMQMDAFETKLSSLATEEWDRTLKLLDEFEDRSKRIRMERYDTHTSFFRAAEDLESAWFTEAEKLIACINQDEFERGQTQNKGLLEETMDSVVESDNDDETKKGTVTKEDLLSELTASHDNHVEKILSQEDVMRNELSGFYSIMFDSERDKHHSRHRDRIVEMKKILKDVETDFFAAN